MKRLFNWMMIYLWGTRVGIPVLFWIINRRFPDIYRLYCPDEYQMRAAIIMTLFTAVLLFLVWILPIRNTEVTARIHISNWYFYIVLFVQILLNLRRGNFNLTSVMQDGLNGGYNGTLAAYVGIFFEAATLYVVFALCKEDVNIILVSGIYLLLTIVLSSRSGALFVGVVLVSYLVLTKKGKQIRISIHQNIDKHRKWIKRILIVLCAASPLLFVFTTNNRSGAKILRDVNAIFETIAGRCSNLETDGILLYQSENELWDEELFYQKYGLVNQAKGIINQFVPGGVFEDDSMPNIYYRAVMGIISANAAKQSYTSICVSFPTYLIVKYGYFVGFSASIMIVLLFYCLCSKVSHRVIGVALMIIILQEIVVYFDWVMIAQRLKYVVLTTAILMVVDMLTKGYKINIPHIAIPHISSRKHKLRIK